MINAEFAKSVTKKIVENQEKYRIYKFELDYPELVSMLTDRIVVYSGRGFDGVIILIPSKDAARTTQYLRDNGYVVNTGFGITQKVEETNLQSNGYVVLTSDDIKIEVKWGD